MMAIKATLSYLLNTRMWESLMEGAQSKQLEIYH